MTKRTIIFLSTALAITNSYATNYQHNKEFYIEPALGAIVDLSDDYGSSPLGSVSIGYSINNEFNIQLSPYAGATANAVMAEGIWNLPINTNWRPYVAAGAGYANMDSPTVGLDVGGGLHYQFAPNADVSLNYRYLQALDDDLNNGHIVTVGLKIYFGGAFLFSPESTKVAGYQLPSGIDRCRSSSLSDRQSVGCYTMSNSEVTMHLDVKFDFDKSQLTAGSKVAINRMANFMKQYPETSVTLYGYASWEGKGSKAYNKNLSLRRANNVKNYLNQLNIDASRVKTIGMGVNDPMVSNNTESGRAINRRVEATINLPVS
ncbi:OmpA family protein [Thiotrichales bacterium 19S9-12]|nr:OmpA family protein [Thiotrichales bacterium 19S9-11]MCF6811481.1 OmpA family protein [Thiotrichales bacterium 19S9-12]